MNRFRQLATLAAAAATALSVVRAPAALAQYYNPGVANVSAANGYVVIVRADGGTQAAATINAPVVTGDYLSTGSGSSAEVQFDGVSMLRLASNSQVRFVNLSPGSREAQLGAGTVDLAELQGNDGGAQIDTPSVTVRPNTNGDYRVSVNGNGQTAVTVRSGSATVTSGTGSQTLTPGTTLVAYGPYSNPSISTQGAIGFDSFDQYNMSRDQALSSAYNSNPYLSPQLAGYSNLANYGQWQNVPGYGWSWAPNNQTQNNFAPYQNGQWVWEPGTGYTWVDNAPYGYPVTHYGSWFNNPSYGGWLWQPPGYQYQTSPSSLSSAWLPAAVSFFLGGGSGVDLGSLLNGFGGLNGNYGDNTEIGWIPLAPGEQYQPWYGQNYSYPATELTTVPTVTNVYNYYTNARYAGGMTVVPVNAWRSGSYSRYRSIRPTELSRVYLIRGSVPVVPTTANLRYSRTQVVSHPVPLAHTFTTARFTAKAPPEHVSFAQQQARIKEIAVAKPKVVPFSAHRVAAHPVYSPAKHAEVHVTAMKPVSHTSVPVKHEAPVKHETAPKPVEHAKPETKPVEHAKPAAPKPVEHAKPAAPKPVEHAKPAAPKPVEHPKPAAAKPVEHQESAPVAHHAPETVHTVPHEPAQPVVHHEVPAAKPVMHEAVPPKPVVHEAPRPVVHEAAPPKPAAHPAPAAKPAEKPVESKPSEEKPDARPTAAPRPVQRFSGAAS